MAVVTCVVCAAATETGMACARCEARIDRQLSDIVEFYAIACGELLPGRGGDGRSGERGLGVRIDALDFVAGNIVVDVLELWERDVRETYGLAPYGPVSLARSQGQPRQAETTLLAIVAFLRAWLPRLCQDFLPIDDLALEVRSCWRQAQVAAAQQPRTTWRVACPTVDIDGNCGHALVLSGSDLDGQVTCRGCSTTWHVDRLLTIVAAETTGAIWMDSETAARHAGVDERTLRRWAREGKVVRDHGRYDIKSIEEGTA